jgi:hypothetical protein
MSAVHSVLSNDQALALRIVRSEVVPRAFWNWLNGNLQTPLQSIAKWIDPAVATAIREVIEPSLAVANTWERQQCRHADAWIAGILGFSATRGGQLQLIPAQTMLAASMLPLYRSLAVGRLNEGLEQLRHRLSESLAIVGIADELGKDFVELLDRRSALESPYAQLKSSFNVDLPSVAWLARRAMRHFDPNQNDFSNELADQLQLAKVNPSQPTEADWSAPAVLWRIAEELIAKKAEIVLPRPWAEVPIAWSKISEHWHALTHRLSNPSGVAFQSSAQGGIGIMKTDPLIHESREDLLETSRDSGSPLANSEEQTVSLMIDDVVAMQADFAEAMPAKLEEEFESIEQESGPSIRAHRPSSSINGAIPAPKSEPIDSENQAKIAIVEIHSKSDPLFVNIMRRQIATARNEDRTVCLIALIVEHEDGSESPAFVATHENGLSLWQDRLVNWLAHSPDVNEPCAFITTHRQLVVAMMDVERTFATNMIREGLTEILSGKNTDGESLGRAHIPAKYFVGIGSVSAPNATFAAEQLIDATWRCLSAAQSQGKATIKSIEVF